MDLSQLKLEVDALKALLDDPQEGLATWSMFVGQRWKAIADMWTGEKE